MKKALFLAVGAALLATVNPVPAKAATEDECAIWLCLPGGFPSGCGAAYKEFMDRITHGRPPLPDLSSCTAGPNGETVSGSYRMGREFYEPCEEGFVMQKESAEGQVWCVKEVCDGRPNHTHLRYCQSYEATRRESPFYIKMWIDGDYLGQYFY